MSSSRSKETSPAGRVQPRSDPGRHGGSARPADRPRKRSRAGRADPVPPHQEQSRADRRAGRGQDGHRGRPGRAHRRGRRAVVSGRQAHSGAGSFADRGRHQVPRAVRGATEDHHERADGEPERHHLHRRTAHAGGGRFSGGIARRGQYSEAGAFARRDPVHRRDHARESSGSPSSGTARWKGGSRPSKFRLRTKPRRSRFCLASRSATRSSMP